MSKILFVCLGNICRSPLAEGIARARLKPERYPGIELDSAGTAGYHIGEPPDARAIAVARRHGIDISGLRGRQVAADDFDRFELILAADRSTLDILRRRQPGAAADPQLLLEWCGIGAGLDVPDPYYGDDAGFDTVFELLDRAVAGLGQRLASLP